MPMGHIRVTLTGYPCTKHSMPAAPVARKTILVRAVRMLTSFIVSAVGRQARWMFAAIVMLLVSTNGLNVLSSYVGRDFMTAIEQKQTDVFIQQAILMVCLFVISTLAGSLARYFEERLGLLWRQWLTEKTLRQYMQARTYHFIETTEREQHPDQRISEDIRTLTGTALSFMLMMLNSLLGILAFASVLFAISPLLLLVSFLYAVAGSLLALWLGQPLIALNSRQVDREADFRSELLHVRTHAESIALMQREPGFQRRLLDRLAALVANTRRMIKVNLRLSFFTGNYNYLIQIIPALLVAPLFIDGKAEFGVIAQSAVAFTVLVNAFSLVVSQFPSISSFAAVLTRLNALSEAAENARAAQEHGKHQLANRPVIRFEQLTLASQEGAPPLLRKFSLTVAQGQRTLIHARNKQLLLRLFNLCAGIDNHATGIVQMPVPEQVFFISEKTYTPPGTLREVLGNGQPTPDDASIMAVLEQLGIAHVVASADGLDALHQDWSDTLSVGEEKMLEIARLLLARPCFAFLLRLRSVLSEERMTLVMQTLHQAGITSIYLGKNEFENEYEQYVELFNDGSWMRMDGPGCAISSRPLP